MLLDPSLTVLRGCWCELPLGRVTVLGKVRRGQAPGTSTSTSTSRQDNIKLQMIEPGNTGNL